MPSCHGPHTAPSVKMAEGLFGALESRALVRVSRSPRNADRVDGFVVAVGSLWPPALTMNRDLACDISRTAVSTGPSRGPRFAADGAVAPAEIRTFDHPVVC